MDNLQLPLSFLQLQIDHLYFFLLLPDFLFSVFEYVLLNVRLLVQNAEFVVAVNQLDAHKVTLLASLLIIKNETIHLFLQAIDYQIEFIRLLDLLVDCALLGFVLKVFFI